MYQSQFKPKSFLFEVRNGELIQVPEIESIIQYKNYIKSIIKERIDPNNEFYDYEVFLIREGIKEQTTFQDINLDQAIHIAQYIGIEHDKIVSNPDHFTILGPDKNLYKFCNSIFDNCNDAVINKLASIITSIFELQNNDCLHLFLPEWMNSQLAGYILEICIDAHYGPNVSLIDPYHPRREEIELNYL